jgi:FG-GAP-like repeat
MLTKRLVLAAVAGTAGILMTGAAAHAAPAPQPSGFAAAARSAQATVTRASGAEVATGDPDNLGDLDGDGKADLAAIDSAGRLWVYPGKGVVYSGTGARTTSYFGTRFQAGSGWNTFDELVRHGDWNHDGKQDILARDPQGRLYLYAGTGSKPGIVAKGVQVGSGFDGFEDLVGVGDVNFDGWDDLMGRKNGSLFIYYNTQISAPFQHANGGGGSGWNGDLLTTTGDWTGDGHTEFLFRATGHQVSLYQGTGGGVPANGPLEVYGSADGAFIRNMVGMGNLTSDATIDGEPVTNPIPDVVVQTLDGGLYFLGVDVGDDFDTHIGSGWSGYQLF